MTHPAVYGIAIAVGVVACIFTFFKNRQQPYGHGGPPAPGPPPPYDYPTKEKRSNTKKRAPENDTSPRADIRHHSPPPPYEHSPTRQVENSNLRNRRPQNDTSQTPPQRVERNIRNEAAGFSGSPHFLNENNSTNNILSIDEPITSRTPMQPERGNSAAVSPTSDNSGNFEHISENNSNSGSFEELNIYNCAICTGLIDQESPKQTVPCKHNFHLRCITEHLRVSQNCPWCGVGIRSLNF